VALDKVRVLKHKRIAIDRAGDSGLISGLIDPRPLCEVDASFIRGPGIARPYLDGIDLRSIRRVKGTPEKMSAHEE
jgi:hypothetical protein